MRLIRSNKYSEREMRGASTTISAPAPLNPREKALDDYKRRLREHKELSAKLKQSKQHVLRLDRAAESSAQLSSLLQ